MLFYIVGAVLIFAACIGAFLVSVLLTKAVDVIMNLFP